MWPAEARRSREQVTPVDWSATAREPFQRLFPEPATRLRPDSEERRAALHVRVEDVGDLGDAVPAPAETFQELGVLPEYALVGLRDNGIATPMPIQAQALPLVLAGRDVIGLAQRRRTWDVAGGSDADVGCGRRKRGGRGMWPA